MQRFATATIVRLSVLLACIAFTVIATADTRDSAKAGKSDKLVVVTLNVGGEVTGVIIKETRKTLTIETSGGVVEIDKEEIDSIEDGNMEDLYKKKLKKTDLSDAGEQYRLAMWCKRFHKKEYKKHLKKCLEIQPDHIAAQEELGLYKWEDEWLPYEEYQKARGYVKYKGKYYPAGVAKKLAAGLVLKHGRWITPGSSRRGTSKRGVREITVPTDVAGLLKTIEKGDREHRAKAFAEITARPDGIKILRQELPKLIVEKEDSIKSYIKSNVGSLRRELGEKLRAAREYARAGIFDKGIYPDANHGKSGQAEIDKRVGKVRLYWEQPLSYCIAERRQLKEKWEDFLDLISFAAKYAGGPGEESYKLRLEGECSEIVNMRKYFSPPKTFEILASNKKTPTTMDEFERGVFDLNNEYRIMLGFPPFKIDEKLVQTARKHSTCMRDNNFFSHSCRIHGSMAARGRAEGTSVAGENIAMGQQTSFAAFNGWYNSSGHHRNMLGRFRSLGVGKAGSYWTQNFR
ncbi:MAG: CAP domain-containing protein [Planctomycetota bacterium]|jgi:hypothetical protein